jgi:hypothetical protein
LPTASYRDHDGRGWEWVGRIAPDPDERVWFIAENWHGGSPPCYVFEGRPAAVVGVLGNSHGFEYLMASKRLEWLIAEDHHGVIVVAGQAVVDRLERVVDRTAAWET